MTASQRSSASLNSLADRSRARGSRSGSPSEDILPAKVLLKAECRRLKSRSGVPLNRAKYICKALGLHLLFHEIATLVESDNEDLISCFFAQAQTFLQRRSQGESAAFHRLTTQIESLQKKLRIKSHKLHQLPCTPATALRRARLIQKHLTPASRILCVGDDDFVSVALALMVPNQITVLDRDPQVLAIIRDACDEWGLRLVCQKANIRKPLPQDLHNAFEIVTTDPIYSFKQMLLFLSAAETCLRNCPGSLLLSCCCRSLAGGTWHGIEEWAASRHLVLVEFLPGFNEYPKTPRMKFLLGTAARFLLRSPVARACLRIPFIYSDLIIFRRNHDQHEEER